MTVQIPDEFEYKGSARQIVGIFGPPPFDPGAHGFTLATEPLSSACWRNWSATYGLEDERLVLRELRIATSPSSSVPEWFASAAGTEGLMPGRKGLAVPCAFTGGLLIGDDLVGGYMALGAPVAWHYREVSELAFRDGCLAHQADVSGVMAVIRTYVDSGSPAPPPPDVLRPMADAFRYAYAGVTDGDWETW